MSDKSPKSNNAHAGHRARMRERFLNSGFENFTEHEILEMLLYYTIPRQNTNELAHKILEEYKTLVNVFDADIFDIVKIKGVGERSAVFLSMIPALVRFYEKSKFEKKPLLCDTERVGQFAISLLRNKTNEHFALICLDSNRRVHWSGVILEGALNSINAYPRRVMKEVLKHDAKNVIFVHNHPHGTLIPSASDKKSTRQLIDILNGIDVAVLDHIIVSENRFYSMAEMGFTFSPLV